MFALQREETYLPAPPVYDLHETNRTLRLINRSLDAVFKGYATINLTAAEKFNSEARAKILRCKKSEQLLQYGSYIKPSVKGCKKSQGIHMYLDVENVSSQAMPFPG